MSQKVGGTNYATDPYNEISVATKDPGRSAAAVTPADGTALKLTRALYVGGTGDVAVLLADDTVAVTFKAVPVGTWLWLRCQKVMSTNTTATLILAIY